MICSNFFTIMVSCEALRFSTWSIEARNCLQIHGKLHDHSNLAKVGVSDFSTLNIRKTRSLC